MGFSHDKQNESAVIRTTKTGKKPIYCDGCCEGGVMGIGVYSEEFSIAVSRRLNGSGTNNVAECLAAIEALQEARRQGLSGITLYSDSQLVVRWTTGVYACRSATATKYIPRIRRLLKAVNGRICWIPGATNPADEYSREKVRPIRSDVDPIKFVAKTPIADLRFRDFAKLKSGRDQFSKFRIAKLKELVPNHEQAEEAFEDEKRVASCLRWVMRGLPIDKAIRKVKTDMEIAENAIAARRS